MKKIIIVLGLFISLLSLSACSKTPKDVEALFEMFNAESYNFTVNFEGKKDVNGKVLTGLYKFDDKNVWYEAKATGMIPDNFYSLYTENGIKNYEYKKLNADDKDSTMVETSKYPTFDAYNDIKNILEGKAVESFTSEEKKVYVSGEMTIKFDSKEIVITVGEVTYIITDVEKTDVKVPKIEEAE